MTTMAFDANTVIIRQRITNGVAARPSDTLTEDGEQYPYAASVMGGRMVSTNLHSSRGGTPYRAGIGSLENPRNVRFPQGLSPDRPNDPPNVYTQTAMVNEESNGDQIHAPMNTQDTMNTKVRSPWWDRGNEMLPVNIGNWSASGPQRPSLRLFVMNYRKGSQPNRNTGMHTNPGVPTRDLRGRDVMQATPRARLTVQRYRGQSFSSTTQVLT